MNNQKLGPIQQKWVDALRSGEFKQGQNYLNKDDVEFCCLGVACEIFKDELNLKKATQAHTDNKKEVIGYDLKVSSLPYKVADFIKLYTTGGAHLTIPTKMLTYLNDSGFSFNEIADIITSEPNQYFSGEA